MADLQLYTLVVPNDSQTGLAAALQQQLATNGILGQDGGMVEQLSGEPGDQSLSGVYRARYAGKMAEELEELAQASGFEELPLTGLDSSTSKDGYYTLESADVDQVQPHTPLVQRFDLQLTRKGTKRDYWRAIETNPWQIDHEFGNETVPLEVGVPATASKVQWYNADDGTRAPATPVETRGAELAGVNIYRLADAPWFDPPPFDEGQPPALLYEIPYSAEELVDCRIYDTRGHASKHDADGNLQWQKLFTTQHDFDDPIVMDNGLLRLRLDDSAGTLEAEEWVADAGALAETGTYGSGLYGDGVYYGSSGEWQTLGLDQPDGVTLFDVDLQEVAMVRDRAQLTFDVGGELFALDAIVNRGADAVQFHLPENEAGPIPTDLEDWLAPVASPSIGEPNAAKTLVSRSDVRR